MLMIDVRSVSKRYGEKHAVSDLSFHIEEGEIVGLLGLNGAGKSTILKTLGTLVQPSEGEASIAGYCVRRQASQVRKTIGYLPDTPPLYEEMSVLGYLKFVALLKGISRSAAPAAVNEVLYKTQLSHVRGKRLGELSHGYKQRTNIAQALVHKPRVLILDEPINGLDPVQIVEMRDLIVSLRGDHTVVLSSHILSEITKTCDRILVVDQGRLVAEGSEHELRSKADDQVVVEVSVRSETEERLKHLERKLSLIPAIDKVDRAGEHFTLCSAQDLRPDIARLIIEERFALLALGRKEAQLETLFLKLVRGERS
jgi:ABC-2 type transport system ATP-binding protein